MYRKYLYTLVIAMLISTLAIGAEVRKLTQEDIEWTSPTYPSVDCVVTSAGGHVGRPLDNTYKLSAPYVDVRGCAPVGTLRDGTVVWTTYINSAISAAFASGGGTVIVPSPGTYIIDNSINLKSNVNLYIPTGTIIKIANSSSTFNGMINAYSAAGVYADNVHIFGGGTLDGNKANQTALVKHHGIMACGSHWLIENIEIKNIKGTPGSMGDGIIFTSSGDNSVGKQSTDIRILYPYLHDNDRLGLTIESGERVWIESPVLFNNGGGAIDIEPQGGVDGGFIKDVTISNPMGNGLIAAVTGSIPTAALSLSMYNIDVLNAKMKNSFIYYRGVHTGKIVNPTLDNGYIFVYGDNVVNNERIDIINPTINGTPSGHEAIRLYSNPLMNSHIKIINPTIKNSLLNSIYSVGSDFLHLIGGTIDNAALYSFYAEGTNSHMKVLNPSLNGFGVGGLYFDSVQYLDVGGIDGYTDNVSAPAMYFTSDNNIMWRGGNRITGSAGVVLSGTTNSNWYGTFYGSFTFPTASSYYNVPDVRVRGNVSKTFLFPTNNYASTIMGSLKSLNHPAADDSPSNYFRLYTTGLDNTTETANFDYMLVTTDNTGGW